MTGHSRHQWLGDGRDVGGWVTSAILAGRTPADQLKVVGEQLKAGLGRHLADLPLDAGRFQRQHGPARDAHQVMVVLGLADRVPMTAVPGVDAIEHTKLSQEVERAEHRRSANPAIPGLDILPDFY
jgi:hypothetical protein